MNNVSRSDQPLPSDRDELKERLVHVGLGAILSAEETPDFTDQVLRRLDEKPVARLSSFLANQPRLAPVRRILQHKRTRSTAAVTACLTAAACMLLLLRAVDQSLGEFAAASDARQVALAIDNSSSANQSLNATNSQSGTSTQTYTGTSTQTYTVMVPQARSREVAYTVNVPEQRTRVVNGREQSYTVMVPSQKTRNESYTVMVPEQRTRNYSVAATRPAALDGVNRAVVFSREASRKVRYNTTLSVVVDQFDGVSDRVTALVTKHDGFVAHTNLGQMRGEQRSGSWTIRIPVENYQTFLDEIDSIGILDARNESAADVTAQYTDVERRIANKKALEERILKLLKRPDDELNHVIEVERELARIRSEIEAMEGQLNVMQDQTTLATISLNVREERDYVPPTAPTVSSRLGTAWSNGFSRAGGFFVNLAIWFIERLIPIVVCLVVAVLLLRFLRRWWAHRGAGQSGG